MPSNTLSLAVLDDSIKAIGGVSLGQCRFVYSTTTSVVLLPFNGNQIFINGAFVTVPSSGVALSNSGLTFGTLYYVYAYVSGGSLTLEAATTTHATSSTFGNEIKSGDPTRTLVGMVYMDGTSGTGTFADAPQKRWVASYFNRISRVCYVGSQGAVYYTSSSSDRVELSTSLRLDFLSWADENYGAVAHGWIGTGTAGYWAYAQFSMDGAYIGTLVQTYCETGSGYKPLAVTIFGLLSEGRHTLSLGSYGNGSQVACNPYISLKVG